MSSSAGGRRAPRSAPTRTPTTSPTASSASPRPPGRRPRFTFDALGRHATKTESGSTDTYTYAGESSVVVRDAPSSGTRTNAAVDATGTRLAISTSAGGFGWALADLHGDPAGYVAAAGAAVTDAVRYDPYGEISASVSSGLPSPWGYQGRLQLADASDTSLFDFGFRAYAPDLGLFTSPDDVAGSALNPVTFARYLYAGANPETLVDPDGHCMRYEDNVCADHRNSAAQQQAAHNSIVAYNARKQAKAEATELDYGRRSHVGGKTTAAIAVKSHSPSPGCGQFGCMAVPKPGQGMDLGQAVLGGLAIAGGAALCVAICAELAAGAAVFGATVWAGEEIGAALTAACIAAVPLRPLRLKPHVLLQGHALAASCRRRARPPGQDMRRRARPWRANDLYV